MSRWGIALFFMAEAALLWWGVGAERPPGQVDFQRLPFRLSEWRYVADDPDQVLLERVSRADCLVARYYTDARTRLSGHVLVAWYRSQLGGARQPHQPTLCLTGSGWTQAHVAPLHLGGFTARRIRAERRAAASELVYWYQTRRRAIGDEWTAKWWLVIDAARDRRTDGALVRVSVPVDPGREQEAERAANRLAVVLQQEMARLWPR